MLTVSRLALLITLCFVGVINLVHVALTNNIWSVVASVACFVVVVFDSMHYRDVHRWCVEGLLMDNGIKIGKFVDNNCYVCEDGSNPDCVCNECLSIWAGSVFREGGKFGFMDSKGYTQKGWDALGPCIIAYRRDGGDWT
jgi:hypothetical protein